MKEEAGVLPIRRLLAVDTEARVSMAGQHPTHHRGALQQVAPGPPVPPGFCLQTSKKPRWEQLAPRPDSHAWAQRPCCRPLTAKPSRLARLSLPHHPGTRCRSGPVGTTLPWRPAFSWEAGRWWPQCFAHSCWEVQGQQGPARRPPALRPSGL